MKEERKIDDTRCSDCPCLHGIHCSLPFTQAEMQWLKDNSHQIKSIIKGNGRASLDMKVEIELWTRRTKKQQSAKDTGDA